MKINEILIESQQVTEGPLMNKLGSAVGKGVGTLAKGVGAVAGGVAGLGRAVKKGFQAGKQTVGGAGDEEGDAAQQPQAQTQPKAGLNARSFAKGAGIAVPKEQPAAQPEEPQAQAPAAEPAAQPAAKPAAQQPAAQQPAAEPTAPAASGGTPYAQVKSKIDQLDKKGKQRILALLQKELGTAPAKAPAQPQAQPAAQPTAEPAAQPAAQPATTGTEKPAPAAGKKKAAPKKKVAPTQAEIDADRERLMGVTTDSVIRKGKVVAESFSIFKRN